MKGQVHKPARPLSPGFQLAAMVLICTESSEEHQVAFLRFLPPSFPSISTGNTLICLKQSIQGCLPNLVKCGYSELRIWDGWQRITTTDDILNINLQFVDVSIILRI